MVDFQGDNTVATAPKNLLNIIILEHYYNLIGSIEEYNKLRFMNSDGSLAKVRARLSALVYCQFNAFKRTLKEEEWSQLEETLDNSKKKTEAEVFSTINMVLVWLDEKRLIRVDDRMTQDFTDVFGDNERNGFT